jgi:hypothetical protein
MDSSAITIGMVKNRQGKNQKKIEMQKEDER